MKTKIIIPLVIMLIVVIGTILIFSESKKDSSTNEKVSFGVMKIPWSAPIIIAHEKGILKKHGIDSEIIIFNLGKEALDAVIKNQVDIATVAETPIAYLAFQSSGDVKVFTNMTKTFDTMIAARSDLGIDSPKDISEKRVSAVKGTASEYALSVFLEENSINGTEYLHLDPIILIPSLVNGDVLAAVLWEPLLSRAKEALGNKIITFQIKNYIGTFNLMATNKYLNDNKKSTQNIVYALIETSEFIEQNPQESKAIIAKFTGIDEKIVSETWSKYSFDIKPGTEILDILKKEGEWIMKQDKTKTKLPDYQLFVDDRFFNE